MKKKQIKKDKTSICFVCQGKKKPVSKVKCCSPDTLAKEKGSWNL